MVIVSKIIARQKIQNPEQTEGDARLERNFEQLDLLLHDIRNENKVTQPLVAANHARRDIKTLLRGYIVADAVALVIGFICAWSLAVLVNGLFLERRLPDAENDIARIVEYFVIGGGVLLWFENSCHYSVRLPFWDEIKKVASAMGFAALIHGFLQFASKSDFSRLWLMSGWMFAGVGMVCLRAAWRTWLRRQGRWTIPTLLVGKGSCVDHVRAALSSEPALGYDIVGQIDDIAAALRTCGNSWKNLCQKHGAAYIMLAFGEYDTQQGEQALAQLMREDLPFTIAPSLYKAPVFGMMPQYFFNHDVMLLTHNHGLDRGLPCMIKRAFDIVVSGLALVMLSPLFLMLTLLIRLDGGAAFYGQKRLGINGRTFNCLKFRSMIVNSDEVLQKYLSENAEAHAEWKRDFKLRKDPRITAVGNFLRKTSLDELPQLINVLRGDMSIVGPRPIIAGPRPIIGTETEKYGHDISHYYRVRPGVTGLWQVSGRNDVSYAQRVHMDSWYVRNWSLWHDIAIIFKTIPVVLKRRGAY